MGINPKHFLWEVCIPACKILNMLSMDALGLMMGTAAIESGMGYSLIQWGVEGGGMGPFQMQWNAHNDCWQNVILPNPKISAVFFQHNKSPDTIDVSMVTDLEYAAMMCRTQYSRFKEALPKFSDTVAVYNYYKKYWNTSGGASTQATWMNAYPPVLALLNQTTLPT